MAQKISSAQLNPSVTTDANGWLVRDFGVFKIASKTKTWSGANMASGGTAFVTIAGNNAPVGFSSGKTVTTATINGNAGNWLMNPEGAQISPTTNWVIKNNTGTSATPPGGGID